MVGRGGEGIVVQGVWGNEPSVFKFVEIKGQKFKKLISDQLDDMKTRLREMIEMESISGNNVLKLEGHHR